MRYAIHHVTRFAYSQPISASMMELRMQPRSEGRQRLVSFAVQTEPHAHIAHYIDARGNTVHAFDVPGRHSTLVVTVDARVDIMSTRALPTDPGPDAWDALDGETADDRYWDMLMPSRFVQDSASLRDFAREFDVRRRDDPLSTLRAITTTVHEALAYVPRSTTVHSPIEEALAQRRGVCQDFAHVMIALARGLRIPCRYVSGYLSQSTDAEDRSSSAADATHAWVEALLPRLGWVGFDPTNDRLAGDNHIRVAVGRDYGDVPPTHGVFKGSAESTLSVAVHVAMDQ